MCMCMHVQEVFCYVCVSQLFCKYILKFQQGSLLLESGVQERLEDSESLDPIADVTTLCCHFTQI